MRVLGIDPGYDRLGLAVVEYQNGREQVLFSHCLETSRDGAFADRLLEVGTTIQQTIERYVVDTVAIETLFFNKNVKTAINVAQARGIILYIARSCDCDVYELSPQEIKIALTGHGNSDKTAVTSMVKQLIPSAPAAGLDDEYDAIAVATTCLAHHGRST